MKKLKLKFVDFWIDMGKPESNYFFQLLSQHYDVEFSDEPDIVFYSCFGKEYQKYTCTRIFYSPENWRPDFSRSDYAMTFDRLEDKRHLRVPLWALYYISYKKGDLLPAPLPVETDPLKRLDEWKSRKNFCSIIVSNAKAPERIRFFEQLNRRMKVDSGGRWNNTIGRELPSGTQNKFQFIKDYRFVISFENASHPGYTTEKVMEPLLAGCIPIYWGDPEIGADFNTRRFIHIGKASDAGYEEAIETILDLERNPEKARAILDEPIFAGDREPICLEPDYISQRLFAWVEEARSSGFKGVGGDMKERVRFFSSRWRSGLGSIKRKIVP